MKKTFFLALLFIFITSVQGLSQRPRSLSRLARSAWKTIEGAWTAKQIYDWVNESRNITRNYYLNPSGRWLSSSGGVFDLQMTSYGLVYKNVYSGLVVHYSATNVPNFYYADRPEAHYYLTILNNQSIIINTCKGREFKWRRY